MMLSKIKNLQTYLVAMLVQYIFVNMQIYFAEEFLYGLNNFLVSGVIVFVLSLILNILTNLRMREWLVSILVVITISYLHYHERMSGFKFGAFATIFFASIILSNIIAILISYWVVWGFKKYIEKKSKNGEDEE